MTARSDVDLAIHVSPNADPDRCRLEVDRHPFRRHDESRTARLFHDFRIREHRILSRRYQHG
jgi:hypothetical protein